MSIPTLSIITATYNRAEYLKGCFESLRNQSSMDFEWIVVDDGSTDNTKAVIEKIIADNPDMNIIYVSKENGGKHTALNASHPYIKGKYMVPLDSDDTMVPEAVELILSKWKEYEDNPEVGQIIFLKGYTEDKPICYVEHENMVVDSLTEPRIGVAGRDCCDSFRSELFVKYPFPEFEGERFIGEGSAFFFVELESKAVYVNRVIYICDYQEDGLTRAGKKMRIMNPLGGMYNSRVYMHPRLSSKTRLKKGILYTCYGRFAGKSMGKILKENEYKGLTLVTYIPGVMLYHYWKKKYLKEG